MRSIKERKAAMELSISTIVIIVLAMTMLIFGIILVRNIFSGATNSIDDINQGVRDEISKAFTDDTKLMAVYPSTKEVSIKRGENRGFAFSLRNDENKENVFNYDVEVDSGFKIKDKCNTIDFDDANGWIVLSSGKIELGAAKKLEEPKIVKIDVPESAPKCIIPYIVRVEKVGEGFYESRTVYVEIV